MADLLIEFRDAEGVISTGRPRCSASAIIFFTSRLVDMPAEQHNIIFSYIAPDEMDAPTIVIMDIKRKRFPFVDLFIVTTITYGGLYFIRECAIILAINYSYKAGL